MILESLDAIYKYYKYFSKGMNLNEQAYESNNFEWYEFDVNFVCMLIATCACKLTLYCQ